MKYDEILKKFGNPNYGKCKKKTYDEIVAEVRGEGKRNNQAEDKIQKECIAWFDEAYPTMRLLLWHIPNGGKRDKKTGAEMKRMGVRAGAPDLQLSISRNNHPFLAIEMKTDNKNSRQQKTQKEMQKALEAQGVLYKICRSVEEFKNIINQYMEGKI